MKTKTLFLLSALFLLTTTAFANDNSFITIDSPSDGDSIYSYNGSLSNEVHEFTGTVSEDCISIRVLWSSSNKKAIEQYLYMNVDPKTYKTKTGNRIDDYVLKQFKEGDKTFLYRVGGDLDNLEYGSNYYKFIATFSDSTVEIYDMTFYVYNGGAAEKAKPVIYLYPKKTQKIKVTVSPEGGVTESIPEMGKEWNVTATPEGVITENKTKKEYPYLYWESKDNGKQIDLSEGFVIETEHLQNFFEEKLAILGLNKKEVADFTEYWVPNLQGKKYIFITFYPKERIDSEAPLSISPKPDSIIRVYFDHKLLDEKIDVKEQVLTPVQRSGFAVVEWGGKRYR